MADISYLLFFFPLSFFLVVLIITARRKKEPFPSTQCPHQLCKKIETFSNHPCMFVPQLMLWSKNVCHSHWDILRSIIITKSFFFFFPFFPTKIYHLFCAVLLTREIPVGSPPCSSNTTNRFPFGCSHERGTWYLILLGSLNLLHVTFFCQIVINWWLSMTRWKMCDFYHFWVASPQPRRHLFSWKVPV